MRLTVHTVNRLLDEVGASLTDGALVFFDGQRPARPSDVVEEPLELVRVRFPSPAFHPAEDGRAMSFAFAETSISKTGEARWARLLTATGEIVADLRVMEQGTPGSAPGDVLVDRSDFHRGGICRLQPLVLTMPRSS